MDGTSSRSRAVPNEAHSEQHIRAPGVGQNAQKMWAQMQNSPRPLETIDATRHGRQPYFGTLWSRTDKSDDASDEVALDRTERELILGLQKVADRRRRSVPTSEVSRPRAWPPIDENEELDQEPEATVEEIMQRGRTRERLAAERAHAEATRADAARRTAVAGEAAQPQAAEATAKELLMAHELEQLRNSIAIMQQRDTTSRDAVLVALMETMKLIKPEPREIKVYTPKDIRDGIVPTCPMEKNATEMREWATTLAGAASGLRQLVAAAYSDCIWLPFMASPDCFR